MFDLPTRDTVRIGSAVFIEPKQDQGSGKLMEGIVKEILTSSNSHPYGIMVVLEDGQIGRVKKMKNNEFILSRPTTNFVNLDEKEVPKNEDEHNEFKETFQFNVKANQLREQRKNKEAEANEQQVNSKDAIRKSIARAVCSFGNAKGGFLYIGVNELGEIIGLDRDVRTFKIKDYDDDFARRISQVLENYIDDKSFQLTKLQMKFTQRDGKTICIIQILPSEKPLFLENHDFYVRGITPKSESMSYQDLVAYCKIRFPNWINNQ